MRKIAGAAFIGPPGPCFHMQQCSAQKRPKGSVWLVSHHQPRGAAAYNRDAYVGQQAGFVKSYGRGAA